MFAWLVTYFPCPVLVFPSEQSLQGRSSAEEGDLDPSGAHREEVRFSPKNLLIFNQLQDERPPPLDWHPEKHN